MLSKSGKYRKPLIWIGSLFGLVLLLIAILVVYIGTRTDEWWRDQITSMLSQTIGREVEIQGDFQLDIGRRVTTKAESIRIGNPEWSESRDMLQLGSLLFEFDLLSTLGDTLHIYRLELSDIDLALEENGQGEKNWEFGVDTRTSTAAKDEGITLPVRIDRYSLQHTQLSLIQPRWDQPLVMQMEKIAGGLSSNDEAVLNANGQLGDLPLSLEGSFGKVSSVLNNGPVSYQLNGKLGDATLASEGSIDSLSGPLRPILQLQFSGPEILHITRAMGAPTIAKGPFEGRVEISPDEKHVKARIQSKFGRLKLHADISANDLASTDNIDLTAGMSGENLAAFANLLALPPLPKGAFALDAVLHRDDGNTQIEKLNANVGKHRVSVTGQVGDWPELQKTRLALKAQGPDLAAFTPAVKPIGLGLLPKGAYTVDALIEPDKKGLRIRRGEITAAGNQLKASGYVYTHNRVRAELDVTGSGPDLSMVSRLADTIKLPAWPFNATGKIVITEADITLIGTTGTAGKHNVAVDGPIAFSTEGPVRLAVKGNGPSLQAVLKGIGYDVIPAAAAYQVDGRVEFSKNQLVVTAQHAQLGPATASAELRIPNLDKPANLRVNVRDLKTADTSATTALAGIKLDLPHVIPADLTGQIELSNRIIGLSKVRGTVGTTDVKIDGTVGQAPMYDHTRLTLEVQGSELEHFLPHRIDQAIPFYVKGKVSKDKGITHFQDLNLKLANIEARVHGKLGNWENLKGSELSINGQGPNLDIIAAIIKRPLPEGAVKFDAHVRGVKDAFHIDRMKLEVGRSNLSGDLKLIKGEPPFLKGQLSSTFFDYSLVRKEVEGDKKTQAKSNKIPASNKSAAEDEFEYDGVNNDRRSQKKRKLKFPHTPVDLSALARMNLDIKISIDELANLFERGSLHDLVADVHLEDRNLLLTNFNVRGMSGGHLKGNVALLQHNDVPHIDVDLIGEKLHLGLVAPVVLDPESFPPTDFTMKLSASGNTYRNLASSLNGRIKVTQGRGLVSNSRTISFLSDTFFQLFQAINPFAKTEPTTQLSCAVYIMEMGNGNAEVQTVVIQTDKLTIVSGGNINLNTEQMNIGFNTRPRRGVGISASMITNSYIRLGGSLSRPSIELDPERATVATGAAVATGGLSFLFKGVWDRFFTSRNPCGEALARDAELQRQKSLNLIDSKEKVLD